MSLITRKRIVWFLLIIATLLLGYGLYYGWQVVAIGAAYKAKVLCSGVFVSKRNPEHILNEDLEGILSIIDFEIDHQGSSVITSFPGVPNQRAIFRQGLGCTLLADASEMKVRGRTTDMDFNPLASSGSEKNIAGLKGFDGELSTKVSAGKLTEVIDEAFSDRGSDNPVRTRAVVVIHGGQIIAERYAPGISPDTALPGWSMTKSVINALVGILVKQGRLSIYQPVRIAEWSGDDDPRADITLDQLLRMSSGLEFDERTGPVVSDVNRMLLRSPDVAAYAIDKPLEYSPDTHWHYSSGATNIISSLIRASVGGTLATYLAFPRRALFDRIGMHNATIEPDAAGNLVGSSFMYATARDWARFGLLYLQDGVWEGERILPEGWVSYSTTPTPTAPKGKYGAHFWTNGGADTPAYARPWQSLPADSFYAAGYEGQYIVVIPSRKLVVVRLGLTKDFKAWDMESYVSSILEAIAER